MKPTYIEVLIALATIFIWGATAIYFRLISQFRGTFEDVNLVNGVSSLFIHIDHHKSKLRNHVIAGLLLISGTGGLLTLITIGLLDSEHDISLGVSIFSAYTIVFFFVVEMWVLWQTLRTNFEQGHVIADFRELILKLTSELCILEDELRQNYLNGTENKFTNQRLLVVAPHFIFGMMSFPKSKIFDQYIEALRAICKMAAKLEEEKKLRLPIKFIYGSEDVIKNWHSDRIEARYSKDKEENNEQEKQIEKLNKEFKKYIFDIFSPIELDPNKKHFATTNKDFSNTEYLRNTGTRECLLPLPEQFYVRMNLDFEVQFMVIGGVLFEFTLNSQNDYTSIRDTQVVRDERTIRTYIAQFDLLSRLALDETLLGEQNKSI